MGWEMPGQAFLEHVEALAAVTQGHPIDVPRSAEVLNLKRASIVRTTSNLIASYKELSTLYIIGFRELPALFEQMKVGDPDPRIPEVVASLNKLCNTLTRRTVVDKNGINVLDTLHEFSEDWSKRSSDEGRYVRRLAKKVCDAGEACDVQRGKLLSIISRMIAEAKELERLWCEPADKADARLEFDAIFKASIDDHPVITAYLAR